MIQLPTGCVRSSDGLDLEWIKLGGLFGLAAIAVYVAAIGVPMPDRASTALIVCFGPLLSLGSYSLYRLLSLNRNTVSLQIAPVANVLAGALLTAMLLVQLSVRADGRGSLDSFLWTKLRRIDLGLDVAWDVYICLGTFLFAWNMLRHPRFGRIFGGIGLALAAGLAVLNLWTFPTPPAYAGLVDLGPLVALWYTAVFVQMLRSRRWAADLVSNYEVELSKIPASANG